MDNVKIQYARQSPSYEPVIIIICSFFVQGTNTPAKQKKKSSHGIARFIASSPCRSSSQLSSVAHRKASFSVCSTAKLGNAGDKAACIVEPYSATRLPISQF